jgi:hypothetical protein
MVDEKWVLNAVALSIDDVTPGLIHPIAAENDNAPL